MWESFNQISFSCRTSIWGTIKDRFLCIYGMFWHFQIIKNFSRHIRVLIDSMCVSDALITNTLLSYRRGWTIWSNWWHYWFLRFVCGSRRLHTRYFYLLFRDLLYAVKLPIALLPNGVAFKERLYLITKKHDGLLQAMHIMHDLTARSFV